MKINWQLLLQQLEIGILAYYFYTTVDNNTTTTTKECGQEVATLRVRAAGDADWFVVDLQADGTGELALDALGRCSSRAWTAAAAAGLLLLLLLPELAAR